MNRKQVLGILIISFFFVASAYAKQKEQPPQSLSADDIVAKMTTQLGLTDKQMGEVKPIIENYLAQVQQLKIEEKKELKKVLTGDQMYTWNFLQNEAPPKDKKKRK